MGRHHGQLIVTLVLLAILLSAILGSCGVNRKTLAFFFDGVPVQVDSTTDSLVNNQNPAISTITADLRKARADSIAAANQYLLHSPYAEGECNSCHNMESRKKTGNSIPSLSPDPASGTGWLIIPVEELCIICHEDMSVDYAEENELSIHFPVAEGMCITCHNPHRSQNEHLLKTKTARELCLQCHDESIPAGENEHPELEDDDDCTMCHNPHLSVDEYFLE